MNIKKILLYLCAVFISGFFISVSVSAANGTLNFGSSQYALGDKISYAVVGGLKNTDFCISEQSEHVCSPSSISGTTDANGYATGSMTSNTTGVFSYLAIFIDNNGVELDTLGPVNVQIASSRPRIVQDTPTTTVGPKTTAAGGTTGDPCDPVRAYRAADKDKNFPTISRTSKNTNKEGLVSCAQYLMSKVQDFNTDQKPNGPSFKPGVYDDEMYYWVRVFQNGMNLAAGVDVLGVDGVIGPKTWTELGRTVSVDLSPTGSQTGGGSGDKPTPLGDCKDFDFVTEKCLDAVAPGTGNGNPKNTDLCGFLGEGYQEKNGLCFPPEVVKGSSGSIVASDSIGTLIRNIMRILLTLAGALAVLFIVIGSVMYTTAEGNEGRAKQGKAIITRAIIGLVGSALAYTIVTIVYNLLTSGSVFSG